MRCFLRHFTEVAMDRPAGTAAVAAPIADVVCDEEAIDQAGA
jgi:hypothetical protein